MFGETLAGGSAVFDIFAGGLGGVPDSAGGGVEAGHSGQRFVGSFFKGIEHAECAEDFSSGRCLAVLDAELFVGGEVARLAMLAVIVGSFVDNLSEEACGIAGAVLDESGVLLAVGAAQA